MKEQEKNEVRLIQLKCLEILTEVHRICCKYNIEYSLCGGSVVGAYLYKGCLPWDDDIDLMMTRKNYNRFLEVCASELPQKYFVQNYLTSNNYYTLFTKIVDTSTTLVQKANNMDIVSGVFLDITVYDQIPQNGLIRFYDEILWRLSQWCLIGKSHEKSIKALVRNLFIRLVGTPPTKYYLFLQKVLESNSKWKRYSYAEYFGSFCNTKTYDKEIFENYTLIEFEGKQYMIVRNYLDYLVRRYERTDFREPEEKQIAPHYQYVNLDKPYMEYIGAK